MDGVGGRRRLAAKSSAEDQALDQIAKEAEARLWAKRQARAEAREIRMRELERTQKEQEENADRQFDMLAEQPLPVAVGIPTCRTPRTPGTPLAGLSGLSSAGTPGMGIGGSISSTSRFLSSRRSSEDSLEDGGSLRDLRNELKEVEEKFRKAMIANAQLDNDKAAQTYQLELLKDRLEELEEEHSQLKREHREKCRDYDQLTRSCVKLKEDLAVCRAELEERDMLIAQKGLVIVGEESFLEQQDEEEQQQQHQSMIRNGDHNASSSATSLMLNGSIAVVGNGSNSSTPRKALVSVENAQLLESAGEGSLDVRLAKFAKEKSELQDQISHLKLELEEERSKRKKSTSTLNGPSSEYDDEVDIQREARQQLGDYKFRAQKAEQDVATLQATVARLESQVIRYKAAAEVSEKAEEALKSEKRKLQREAREALSRAEELETSNTHLLKRLDKLKNAKSTLLKEL